MKLLQTLRAQVKVGDHARARRFRKSEPTFEHRLCVQRAGHKEVFPPVQVEATGDPKESLSQKLIAPLCAEQRAIVRTTVNDVEATIDYRRNSQTADTCVRSKMQYNS